MNYKSFPNRLGFTLIELLVVISIIGVLVAIGASNFITAQKQARDTSRKQTLSNIQSAFEQYYAQYASYPNQLEGNIVAAFDNNSLPTDPKNTGEFVIDFSHTDTSSYCICAILETNSGNAIAPASTTCNWTSESATHYCIQNKQ